jgi:CheY-like chemotaxis protein
MTSGELVLLVNDIPDHVERYETALTRHGYRVRVARSAAEALACTRAITPDCAVIDLRLPDMSGWELCSEIKESSPHTRVVVLTPDVSKTCAADSTAVGCHAWLAHPTVPEDLARTVRQVLDFEADQPASPAAALIGMTACPGCESEHVRAQLRVGLVQYFGCKACGLSWRMETVAAHP